VHYNACIVRPLNEGRVNHDEPFFNPPQFSSFFSTPPPPFFSREIHLPRPYGVDANANYYIIIGPT
jgi:hypothetical protein